MGNFFPINFVIECSRPSLFPRSQSSFSAMSPRGRPHRIWLGFTSASFPPSRTPLSTPRPCRLGRGSEFGCLLSGGGRESCVRISVPRPQAFADGMCTCTCQSTDDRENVAEQLHARRMREASTLPKYRAARYLIHPTLDRIGGRDI